MHRRALVIAWKRKRKEVGGMKKTDGGGDDELI
jgi:hypothetical protein